MVFQELWKGAGSQIVQKLDLALLQDHSTLEQICSTVINRPQDEVRAIRGRNKKILNKLIGLVQRAEVYNTGRENHQAAIERALLSTGYKLLKICGYLCIAIHACACSCPTFYNPIPK
ncbi:glutamyl-tRNA(Gln) amidotransferase subunit B, mitochondrial-like [Acipenser ruthenus]|uniref:glutamyl-tRNA(Gln) amidotransferase subunit B, mitochondrial-like n=1 Tax=Acipenser ruthenus TaxID=7906 RepID=UPI002740C4BD|nr:glutamyl-tRNA(Gln) amidotransferase subunit B, mitochondrial-like [Acipenser ruthenus]